MKHYWPTSLFWSKVEFKGWPKRIFHLYSHFPWTQHIRTSLGPLPFSSTSQLSNSNSTHWFPSHYVAFSWSFHSFWWHTPTGCATDVLYSLSDVLYSHSDVLYSPSGDSNYFYVIILFYCGKNTEIQPLNKILSVQYIIDSGTVLYSRSLKFIHLVWLKLYTL